MNASPSASVASTEPIDVWFSFAIKLDEDVLVGASLVSLKSLIVIFIDWEVEFWPSVAVTVPLYEYFVS